jgi:hypothetical protein
MIKKGKMKIICPNQRGDNGRCLHKAFKISLWAVYRQDDLRLRLDKSAEIGKLIVSTQRD